MDAFGSKPKSLLQKPPTKAKEPADALIEMRPVWFDGRFMETPVYLRDDVPAGSNFRGPVIFEELGSTTVVEPGWTARVEDKGNLILEVEA